MIKKTKKNKQTNWENQHRATAPQRKGGKKDASLLLPAPKQPAWRSFHSRTPARSITPMMCPRACFLRVRHARLLTELPVQRHRDCASAEPENRPSWGFVVRTPLSLSLPPSRAPARDPRSANGRRLRPGCRRETRRAARRSCLHTHSGLGPPRRSSERGERTTDRNRVNSTIMEWSGCNSWLTPSIGLFFLLFFFFWSVRSASAHIWKITNRCVFSRIPNPYFRPVCKIRSNHHVCTYIIMFGYYSVLFGSPVKRQI